MRWMCALALCATVAANALSGDTLTNGGFEEAEGGAVKGWQACGSYTIDQGVVKSGKQSIRCETADENGVAGVMQQIVYAKPDKTPVLFSGWSRAESVAPGTQDYCIYLDIWYAGGGNAWGVRAHWAPEPHDWEYTAEVFYPEKPISKIQCFVFIRKGVGRVWFDDMALERRTPALGVKKLHFASDAPRTKKGVHATVDLWTDAAWRCWMTNAEGTVLENYTGHGARAHVITEGTGSPTTFHVAATSGKETFAQSYALPAFTRKINTVRDGWVVWVADSMQRVTPLTYPSEAQVQPAEAVMDVARNECESVQVLSTTSDALHLKNVTVSLAPFVDENQVSFNGEVTWERVGYIPRDRPFLTHPQGVPPDEVWLPDPLLPSRPFDVRAGATQGVWLTARAGDGARPGTYHGAVTLSPDNHAPKRIPLTIRVRGARNPKRFGMPTAFCVMDGFTRAQYPDRFAEMKRKTHDLLLSHRLNPDDISRTEPPEIDDLVHARERGMNLFNILNLVPKPDKPAKWVCYASLEAYTPAFYEELKARLTPYVAELRKHDLVKDAYLYGFDERDHTYYTAIDALWRRLRADFPDIPVLTTAMMFRDMKEGKSYPCIKTTDWFCPLTNDYAVGLADSLRTEGKQVWWYVCCGPHLPYANFASVEYPFIDGRLLGWMTYRYKADGLLYWHVNLWPDAPPLKSGDTFLSEWRMENSVQMPGDGQLLYPCEDGPVPSIRLANIRDGIEDYEWLTALEVKDGRAAGEAQASLLVRSMTDFERRPEALRKARTRLAEALEH